MSKRLKYAPDSCAEAVELVISSQKSQIDITAPLVFNGGRLGNGAALAALSILTPKQGNEAPRNEPTKKATPGTVGGEMGKRIHRKRHRLLRLQQQRIWAAFTFIKGRSWRCPWDRMCHKCAIIKNATLPHQISTCRVRAHIALLGYRGLMQPATPVSKAGSFATLRPVIPWP